MDGGAWWATVYGVTEESDVTEVTARTVFLCIQKWRKVKWSHWYISDICPGKLQP